MINCVLVSVCYLCSATSQPNSIIKNIYIFLMILKNKQSGISDNVGNVTTSRGHNLNHNSNHPERSN